VRFSCLSRGQRKAVLDDRSEIRSLVWAFRIETLQVVTNQGENLRGKEAIGLLYSTI
jgi:hypothetical protein